MAEVQSQNVSENKNEEVETTAPQPEPVKRKSKLWLVVLLILAVLLIVPVLVAGWFGFVPGLSNIMGAKSARDLGVTYTEADYQSYLEKTGIRFEDFANAPDNPDRPGKKVVFAEPVFTENLNLTQEELTAAINESGWSWMPATNVQIRLSDGVVEASGNLNLANIEQFVNFIGGVGYSQDQVASAADWGRRLADGAPIYIKAESAVTNNQLSFNLQEVQVGRFNVPQDIAGTVLNTGTSNAIINTPNLDVQSAAPVAGGLNFSGTYPTLIYVKTN